jgi:hypothetical protein
MKWFFSGAAVLGLMLAASVAEAGHKSQAVHSHHSNSIHANSIYVNKSVHVNGIHNGPYVNYHLKHGTSFQYGYFYKGLNHKHWSYCYWNSRYGCYFYYDPCLSCYYYWYAPAQCYYPVSYITYAAPTYYSTVQPAPVGINVVSPPVP